MLWTPSDTTAPMALTSTLDNPPPPFRIEETIRAADGVRLRTARWAPVSTPRGTIAVLGGRGEFIEKYFEVAGELLSRDFAVAMMDWRGQGGSDRPLRNSRKGHVDDFSYFERLTSSAISRHWCDQCWSRNASSS